MTIDRHELCTKVFYSIVEVFLIAVVIVLGAWYLQSKQPVVDFDDVPGYRIIAVAHNYIEIKWIEAALITDCPGRVEPVFVGVNASHPLTSYPFVVEHKRKTFTRRYEIPPYMPYGDYELRIAMVSNCNPLFEGRQILRVPFRYEQPDF